MESETKSLAHSLNIPHYNLSQPATSIDVQMLSAITVKIAAVEFGRLMCFYFRLPRSTESSRAAASRENRNNVDLGVSEAKSRLD